MNKVFEQDMSEHCSDVVGKATSKALEIIASRASKNTQSQVSCGESIPAGCCWGMPVE
jgi:hypothetical protein